MQILDALHADLQLDPYLPVRQNSDEESIDLEALKALADFAVVPHDYLLLFAYYGAFGVVDSRYGNDLSLRHPVEAHEFYFEFERAPLMPGMYPMTSGSGPYTLYYGTVEGRTGVYIAYDSSSWLSMSAYIASSLSHLLFDGIGWDRIDAFFQGSLKD